MHDDCPHHKEIAINQDRLFSRSLPPWTRQIFIILMGILFLLYGGHWVYSVTVYATKTEVRDLKTDIRLDLKEIKELILKTQ